ncbi:MAG: diaminopimelate epimerase [Marinagarivorans sp.]|nr:diaminopimelate epimerase [Marinagarivorans sp.]
MIEALYKKRNLALKFNKYHALGNVYIVINPNEFVGEPSGEIIKNVCHKDFGAASDGLLVGPLKSRKADFGLRIFNPDTSEAEKSGNGIRIFCRYLWDLGLVSQAPFSIETKGGIVNAQVLENGKLVKVDMGIVSFSSAKIPVLGESRDVLLETLSLNGKNIIYSAATIGNPHCIVINENPSESLAREIGAQLEIHSNFPNRTNVQFMKILDRNNIKIEIWERGAGYTLASGSSSCASAAVAKRSLVCAKKILSFPCLEAT